MKNPHEGHASFLDPHSARTPVEPFEHLGDWIFQGAIFREVPMADRLESTVASSLNRVRRLRVGAIRTQGGRRESFWLAAR